MDFWWRVGYAYKKIEINGVVRECTTKEPYNYEKSYVSSVVVKEGTEYAWRNVTYYYENPVKRAWHSVYQRGAYLARDPNYKGFRNGYVPGTKCHSYGGGWRKYGCKTQDRASLLRDWKESYNAKEYGEDLELKIKCRKLSEAKYLVIDWDDPYRGKRTKGWKRTRKAKQWM